MPRHVPLGSKGWVDGDCYEADDEHGIQARRLFDAVKWDVLASKASSLHDGTQYTYGDKFSIGQFNMVRRLTFDDGAS